ncbi:hypothetical protein C8046_11665 [Serinibacter arcticus]|uniref:Uncharacterized protein n=1 Tax=Serinibacter arcticus TaxID=1655435 RepID=A0A2U1ZW92_9MICO|nr:tubulin-like doman-containing protein [Serinibacter arcticus]PWD51210.1 hypothetical protein C8046_11665 [Serinibacter arcticus]
MVLVVASMAGGAGASMALDVCRLLTFLPGYDPDMVGVFMCGADVFDGLPKSQRVGVRPNSLAMMGELVAAQNGSATPHDNAMIEALTGQTAPSTQVSRTFARVFPVGATIGGSGAKLGDGSQSTVYRALGRGLGALVTSGKAFDEFVQFDLPNPNPAVLDWQTFGWDLPTSKYATWMGFGYASVSMGRDRYAEYAAQRLARSAVDRLDVGHRRPSESKPDSEVLAGLVEHQRSSVFEAAGLPPGDDSGALAQRDVMAWFDSTLLPAAELRAGAQVVVRSATDGRLPSGSSSAGELQQAVQSTLARIRPELDAGAKDRADARIWQWQKELAAATVAVVDDAVARLGIRYARRLLAEIAAHSSRLVTAVQPVTGLATIDPTREAASAIPSVGVISNTAALTDDVREKLVQNVVKSVRGRAAARALEVLTDYQAGIVEPLDKALANQLETIVKARSTPAGAVGVAQVATSDYAAWPVEGAEPPKRFARAVTEVLVTSTETYDPQFRADLAASNVAQGTYTDVSSAVVTSLLRGAWSTTASRPLPGGVIGTTRDWVSPAFKVDPDGNPLVPTAAAFALAASPADVVGRARDFVSRPNESFAQFVEQGLGAYVTDATVRDAERADRARQVLDCFDRALKLARPLVGADPALVKLFHPGQEMSFRYKFSPIPLAGVLEKDLAGLLQGGQVDRTSVALLARAMEPTDAVFRSVSIFGSFGHHYAPVCYDSLWEPLVADWNTTAAEGRHDWWQWRRSRPLPAALPVTESERRALVGGYLVARICGALQIPERESRFHEVPNVPVRIYQPAGSASRGWLEFPHPLLTPPRAANFGANGWLAALLESVLLAYATASQSVSTAPIEPYRALRRWWDDSEQFASPTPIAAGRALVEWARGADVPDGRPAVTGADPIARIDAARTWLSEVRDAFGTHFMRTGQQGAPGGGRYSSVATREDVMTLPFIRDLAADHYWATGVLLNLLDQVEDELRSSAPAATPDQKSETRGSAPLEIPGL